MQVKQAFIFSILVVLIGNVMGFFVGRALSVDLPPVCKKWNTNYIMELSLFLTGFVSFLVYNTKSFKSFVV